jgi:hypothetical protein
MTAPPFATATHPEHAPLLGQAGQTRTVPFYYPTSREAQAALERQRWAKERPHERTSMFVVPSARQYQRFPACLATLRARAKASALRILCCWLCRAAIRV